MRHQMTKAELRLWLQLRKRGIEGLRFRRQTPIGPYVVDFFCPEKKLIVEVDGGQHSSPARTRHDSARDAWLATQGYKVIRFWNEEVIKSLDAVCSAIIAASKDLRSSNEVQAEGNPPLEGGSKPRSGFGEGATPRGVQEPDKDCPSPEI
jgi:very-short-patch-repair endonuclease